MQKAAPPSPAAHHTGPKAPPPAQVLPALVALAGRSPLGALASPPPLTVAGYGPRGRTEGGATIYVRFNQPVVSFEQVGVDQESVGITLEPPVAGRSYFETPELLVFEPKAALPEAHLLKARLRGPVVAQGGMRYDAPLAWDLETRRPRVTGWQVLDKEDNQALRTAAVLLTVDQPTTLDALTAVLRGMARPRGSKKSPPPPTKPVAVSAVAATAELLKRANIGFDEKTDRGRLFIVRPVGQWPEASEVELVVGKGLRTTAGPLPADREFTTQFRTISPLRLVSSSCRPEAPCGLTPISIRFNNRIPRKQVDKVQISPKPEDFAISLLDSWDDDGRELSLSGIFLPGTTYRVQLPADLTDKLGYRLQKPMTVTAVIARRPTMELSSERGTLQASDRQIVGVVTRHVHTVKVRGAVLDDKTAVALLTTRRLTQDDATTGTPAPDPWPTAPVSQFERTYPLPLRGLSDWSELSLDLAALSGGAHRAILIEVSAIKLVEAAAGEPMPPPVRGLYRLTDLGPVGVDSQPQSILSVTRLSTGKPVAGVRLAMHRPGQAPVALGMTDATGILVANDLPTRIARPPGEPAPMLVAEDEKGADHAYLTWPARGRTEVVRPENEEGTPATPLRPGERPIVHLVTERDAYLPGELVRTVGWSAIDTPYQPSGLRRPRTGTPVLVELADARGRIVASQKSELTPEGKFWAELALPEPGSLGSHTVRARVLGTQAETAVKVEDFRVPEFSVSATVSESDVRPGEATQVSASAAYFFGGPAKIVRAAYSQVCSASAYTPPGLPAQWAVGAALPRYSQYGGGLPEQTPAGGTGQTHFALRPPAAGAEFPRSCQVSVSLTDSSFQSHGAKTQYLAHPARYYLAVQEPTQAITEGDVARIAVRAVAIAGQRLAAPGVRVSVVRNHSEDIYTSVDGQKVFDHRQEYLDPVYNCTLDLAASGPDLACVFPVAQPGRYELTVRGRDKPDTRYALTETALWVQARQPPSPPPTPTPRPASLELVVSATKVKPGDTIKVTLRAPWPQSSGVLLLARNGVREHRAFQLQAGRAELTFPVDDSWFPEVNLEAFLVHVDKKHRPGIAQAGSRITMEQQHRRLQVAVTAPTDASPGTAVPITVRVADSSGRPVRARVALWAVDEAVLSLTRYSVPDLLPQFVPTMYSGTQEHDDYGSLIDPFSPSGADPWFIRRGSGSGRGLLSGRRSSVPSLMNSAAMVRGQQTRSHFETTPLFLADLEVDTKGQGRATVHLPDNLTTFRVTAVASARLVDGDSPGRFGLGDARVRVSTPLIVRAALPRLMRPGDEVEIGALVNNLGGPRGRVQVNLRLIAEHGAPDSLEFISSPHAERSVAVGEQLRLPFQLVARRATKVPMVLEVAATLTPETKGAKVLRDTLQLPLPVELEPTLRERVAVYGDLNSDDAVALPVQLPDAVRRDSGGLSISANTSLLGGVAEAAAGLVEYPYGCVEQTASRLVPLVALQQVMQTYPLPLPDHDVRRYLEAGTERLLSMQVSGGGFTYWPGGRQPNVYASAYATWVLQLLHRAGYPVPKAALALAGDYLYSLVEPPAPPTPAMAPPAKADAEDPEADAETASEPDDSLAAESPSSLLGLDPLDGARRAMAVQALAELGRAVPKALTGLIERRADLPLFARALVVLALHAHKPLAGATSIEVLVDELLANLSELPGAAHVNERLPYSLETLFHSETRTDAMVLLALLRTRPHHPLVTKLARGLLDRRGSTGWRNTQETAYAVLALAEFARVYEHDPPELTARLWVPRLGPAPQWQASFVGRSLATQTAVLPMAQLLPGLTTVVDVGAPPAPSPSVPPGVILQRTGKGRLYYRVGLEWSPAAAELPPRVQGLRVERQLRTAHGEVTAQTQLPIAEPVALDVTIENHTLMSYVVVDIPLPAGLEAVQVNLTQYTSLSGSDRAAMLPGAHRAQVSHQEARRDRALLFFDELPPGTHRHTVALRTTTPGRYTLPPAQAEAMYSPELYGRSSSSQITVTAAIQATP